MERSVTWSLSTGTSTLKCMTTERNEQGRDRNRPTPVVSLRGRNGEVVEMLFRPELDETRLVSYIDGEITEHEVLGLDGVDYVPYSAQNNLLTHRVLRLPSEVGPESNDQLVADIRDFIHRYVDLSDGFEEVAAHYVLLTWVYDKFNEVPYLRVRGAFGTGKSRFLLTVGSICYKPIFASGASTVSPLFRLLDQIGGTLVIDEADFFQSDERAEIVKILNNGNARGFPVLRSEVTPQKEFSPRAFNIFGPKIIATRHAFEDEALESRCLSETLGRRSLRIDIPVSLPDGFEEEAQALRNRLLRYRLTHIHDEHHELRLGMDGISPRRVQMVLPVLHVASDEAARKRLTSFVGKCDDEVSLTRRLVHAVSLVQESGQLLTVGAIAETLRRDLHRSFSDKWVGGMLRGLGLEPRKSNGVYRVGPEAQSRVDELLQEYGLRDVGEDRDVYRGAEDSLSREEPPSGAAPGHPTERP